jgi:hypothetical protein
MRGSGVETVGVAAELDPRSRLPGLVRAYLSRVVPSGGNVPRRVRITQAGEMWQKPGGRPLRFTAVEVFAVDEVAFTWRARFTIVPLISIRVVDGYAADEGKLQARLLGVPFMRSTGPETAEGEAMRYLSELPWVPHAMLANRRLEWREVDARTVEVSTRAGPARVACLLHFDAAGDIMGASTEGRPRIEGNRIVRRPWTGVFARAAVVGGVRIPTRGEVRWELPDGPFTYWRGTITSLELGSSTRLSARGTTDGPATAGRRRTPTSEA